MSKSKPNQTPILIPQLASFEDVRQVMGQQLNQLQQSLLSHFPITSFDGSRLSDIGAPQQSNDAVTLGYLVSQSLPAVQQQTYQVFNGGAGGGGMSNPMIAKGDIILGTTGGTPQRLPVGTNGQVLTANSGAAGGVDWETSPYDVTFAYPGSPPNASTIQLICFTRAVAYTLNFGGSTGFCGTNPTSSAVYTLNKNGVSIGTATVSTLGVFTFSGSAVSFAVGDKLSVLTPATDATLSDVTITLSGTR